jgi:hypothetical protein
MANKIGKTVKIAPPPGVGAGKPPPLSKTVDNYTHHTSPIKGPQPTPVEPNTISSTPKAKIRTLPDVPMAKYKHDTDQDGM